MLTYRYRLYPTASQEAELRRQLNVCCDVYNAALEQRIWWWRRHQVLLYAWACWHPERGGDTALSQTRQLQEARKALPELAMPAKVQNAVLIRLDRAFAAFARRRREGRPGGFPRFCQRRKWRTLVYPSYGQSHEWLEAGERWGRVRLAGIGAVKVRMHRPLAGIDLGQATVSLSSTGRWEITIVVRDVARESLPPTGKSVGINRGVRHLIATSDGLRVKGLSLRADAARELTAAQRALARTAPNSAGRDKARRRLARIHHRIAAERERRLGELARQLVEKYDVIALEGWSSSGMHRRAAEVGPGLAARIAEQGWSILERRLRERCERHGRALIVVSSVGISHICPRCGGETPHKMDARRFTCADCSYKGDRDVTAAQIVLQRASDPEMIRAQYGFVEDGQEWDEAKANA